MESHKYAKEYVYDGIEPDSRPSDEYIERGSAFINEQLAVAGYRLADIITEVYKNHKGVVQMKMDHF